VLSRPRSTGENERSTGSSREKKFGFHCTRNRLATDAQDKIDVKMACGDGLLASRNGTPGARDLRTKTSGASQARRFTDQRAHERSQAANLSGNGENFGGRQSPGAHNENRKMQKRNPILS
jgi:hypothetical protein